MAISADADAAMVVIAAAVEEEVALTVVIEVGAAAAAEERYLSTLAREIRAIIAHGGDIDGGGPPEGTDGCGHGRRY